ncbi:MAG: FKBP-type peptidyl-prolyl cis-trans isomerase [Bryobacteraceae bacterium]|nr:FKBP-type peptidyl-prolyl cis-trans isomerase [Bryobacteraceae bacterium]MDW8378771.1 FKBP-type peptidyl-prolyl cis-trans isomerase [Bryobacterales bacterium]
MWRFFAVTWLAYWLPGDSLLGQAPAPAAKPSANPKPAAVAPRSAASKAVPLKPSPSKPTGLTKPVAASKPSSVVTTASHNRPHQTPNTDDEKTIYALGLSLYRSLGAFDLSPSELEWIKQALTDAAAGAPRVDFNEWAPRFQTLAQARAARILEREKAASQAFLEKEAAQAGAQKTESGAIFFDLVPGAGPSPKATDIVKVHYRGTLINGTEFDSSYKRNQPAEFPLTGVIRCWTEGLQKMKIGGKARLVCPAELAYGDQGRPSIPPGSALIFEVELLGISTP